MDSDKVIDIFLNPYSTTTVHSHSAGVKELQQVLFPISPRKSSSSDSFLCNTFLKPTAQNTEESDATPSNHSLKYRDSKELLQKDFNSSGQAPRWPTECQVLEERVRHIPTNSCPPEPYYTPTGKEVQPKPIGEESGIIVYQYYPISAVNYFCRSSVGGSKYLLPTCPSPDEDSLRFESRFESGNLAKAIRITATYYELYLRTDLYTDRHMQWFYFRMKNMKKSVMYRFSIVNFSKEHSLYAEGMRPLLYSEKDAQLHSIGWRRCGDNVTYFSNDNLCPEESDQQLFYSLTFTLEFPHDDDTVYLAHSYPYTYSDLQEYLLELTAHPIKQTFTTLRLLCKSLAGNNVYYVTVTTPPDPAADPQNIKKKRAVVVTARVHPGETPASWMMRGFLEFLTSDSGPAKELRDKFIFKLVPMLNPDGVIVGNNRCSLTGRDLNRQYRTVIRETYPSIWYTKLMIRRLLEECGVAMYCDLHAHSKKHNIFIFGCENRRGVEKSLQEQVFPLMLHKNAADKFSFENCNFRIRRCKEGTGRVVMWMMGIGNSYTMEASFGGSNLGTRGDTHFNTQDYELMGRSFCQTLLDYYDDDPRKERLRLKIITRLMKEGSNADEPLNIQLSDYSSDEGETTSSSSDLDGEPLKMPFVPPPSPALVKKPKGKKIQKIKEIDKDKEEAKQKIPQTRCRKPLQVRKTNLGLTLTQKSSFSDTSSTDSEEFYRPFEVAKLKTHRKKKKKKRIKKVEFSDTEILLRRVSDRKMNVLHLAVETNNIGQNWNTKIGAMPPHRPIMDNKRSTTQQLSEVQAKLMTLRNKLWYGIGDSDNNIPLSWGSAPFFDLEEKQLPKKKDKEKKISKKVKNKDEIKESKEFKEVRINSSKKVQLTLKRQAAVEIPNMKANKLSPKFRKSKSLSETDVRKKNQTTMQIMKAINNSVHFQPKIIQDKFINDNKVNKKKKKKVNKAEKATKPKKTD